MLRPYELMFVLKPDLDNEAVGAFTERMLGVIQAREGVTDGVAKWGKRRLSYPIQNYTEGNYTVVNFRSSPEVPKELDRLLKISDEVLRFIIVRIGG